MKRPCPPEVLTTREREIFALLLNGHSSRWIGKALFISPKTVETHRAHINRKLRVATPVMALLLAVSKGWLYCGSPGVADVDLPAEVRR